MSSKSQNQDDRIILTYKYRIKDSTAKKHLKRMAGSINYVWNYINDLSYRSIKQHRRFLSEYDIDKYLADGVSKELGISAKSLQEVSKQYVQSRSQFNKRKLSWRTAKRSLGWIPFIANVKQHSRARLKGDDAIVYCGHTFHFYKSRPIPTDAILKTGAFVQDSRDRWYVCITFSVPKTKHQYPVKDVGIDIGIKNQLTLSDNTVYVRDNITKQYADRLATAQRAGKKKQARNMHAKMKNSRNDWTHKITTQIAKTYSTVHIGQLSIADIVQQKNGLATGLYDAAPFSIQQHLIYKASRLGGVAKLIPERNTTRTCSSCLEKTGPTGLRGLSVREWNCPCGAIHERDVNSARNILRLGYETP